MIEFFKQLLTAILQALDTVSLPTTGVQLTKPVVPPKPAPTVTILPTPTPWRSWFLARLGWTEFNHDAELSKGWVLTNQCKNYKTVIGGTHAWCGMSLATALNSSGYKYPLDCESAASYDDYGTPVDWKNVGIPLGAIVTIRHHGGGRHVTTADRVHKPGEKVLQALGGNQGDSICVSHYDVSGNHLDADEIVAVRMPVKA